MKNEHLQRYFIAAIGILGIIVGSIAGHFFSVTEERHSLLEDARRQGYIEFLEAQQLLTVSNRAKANGETEKAVEFRDRWEVQTQAAINKIATYGDPEVVSALASFYRKHSPLGKCRSSWVDDIAIYHNMRISLLGDNDPVSNIDLAELILKCTVSTTE